MYITAMASSSKPGLRTKSKKFIRSRFFPRTWLTEQERYFLDGGNTLLYPQQLPSDSVCLDVGGYLGEFIQGYLDRRNLGFIYSFEPIPEYYKIIIDKFGGHPQVAVLPYALFPESGWLDVLPEGAATTLLQKNQVSPIKSTTRIRCESFSILSTLIPEGKVDWVKINIEGGEYELLQYLISSTNIRNIQTLVVQFHPITGVELNEVHSLLSQTHIMIWGYEFVWERWDLR
jgi:FkbM family methyltransferase